MRDFRVTLLLLVERFVIWVSKIPIWDTFDPVKYLRRTYSLPEPMLIDIEVLQLSYRMMRILGIRPDSGMKRGRIFGPGPSIIEAMRHLPFLPNCIFEMIERGKLNREFLNILKQSTWSEPGWYPLPNEYYYDTSGPWFTFANEVYLQGKMIFGYRVADEGLLPFGETNVKVLDKIVVREGNFHNQCSEETDFIGGDSSFCSHSRFGFMVKHALWMALSRLSPEGYFNLTFVLGSKSYKAGAKKSFPQFQGTLAFYEKFFQKLQQEGVIGPFMIRQTTNYDSDDGMPSPEARQFAVVVGRGRGVKL